MIACQNDFRSQAHLAVDEVAIRYRRAQDPVVRSHWQVIWLLAQGLPSAQVAAVTSYTVLWKAFKRLTAGASADEKAQLFHDTAARIYRLDRWTPPPPQA